MLNQNFIGQRSWEKNWESEHETGFEVLLSNFKTRNGVPISPWVFPGNGPVVDPVHYPKWGRPIGAYIM